MNVIFNRRLHKRGIIVAAVFLTIFFGIHQSASAQVGGGGYIQAIDEVKAGGGAIKKSATAKSQAKPYTPKTSASKKQTTKSPTSVIAEQSVSKLSPKVSSQNKKYDGFIVGDKYTFLNEEIAERVQPIYRQSAKDAGASGLVQVEVLVGENGNVLEARARTGNKLLWEEAEKAALATKFNKPYLYNKPARAAGFIVYRFGKADEEEDDDL